MTTSPRDAAWLIGHLVPDPSTGVRLNWVSFFSEPNPTQMSLTSEFLVIIMVGQGRTYQDGIRHILRQVKQHRVPWLLTALDARSRTSMQLAQQSARGAYR